MPEKSFCAKVKEAVIPVPPKRGCCRKTAEMLLNALTYPEDYSKAAVCADKFLCKDCPAAFLRVCFVKFGTATDPHKSYHLEMSFPDEAFRNRVADVLSSQGLTPKIGMRRDRYILYYKSSEMIEDFFALIGAADAVYEMANLKLIKETTISINRQTNFETANIKKTVEANRGYIAAVDHLMKSGNFDSLPDDLRETAKLRIENDTASMSELGRLHSPSISKSGVKHRLDKLVTISEIIKSKK